MFWNKEDREKKKFQKKLEEKNKLEEELKKMAFKLKGGKLVNEPKQQQEGKEAKQEQQAPTGPDPFTEVEQAKPVQQEAPVQQAPVQPEPVQQAPVQQAPVQPEPVRQPQMMRQPQMPRQQVPENVAVVIQLAEGIEPINVEVPVTQMENFIVEINNAINTQSVIALGNRTINGRYIVSFVF